MFSGAIAKQLRTRGLDAVRRSNAELTGAPDEELLAHTTTQERVLVTANVAAFASTTDGAGPGREHHAVVHVTDRAFPQDRPFVDAIVPSLLALHNSDSLPPPGTGTFLRRT